MSNTIQPGSSIATDGLKACFYDSISEICHRRKLDSSDCSIAYVVNLLCHFARSDQFFQWDNDNGYELPPLALLYGEATQAINLKHRVSALRRLGDIALFVSGIFSQSLARKPIGVDYYITMGGGAYAWLSENLQTRQSVKLDHEVFRELSCRFSDYVNILDEFADNSGFRGNRDLISLYELWLKNNDARIADKIKRKGVAICNVNNRRTH